MANNLDSLNKKADRLLQEVEPPLQGQLTNEQLADAIFDGDPSLFSEQEREAILALVSSIIPRVKFQHGSTIDFLTTCDEQEFAVLCNWQDLLKALQRGDEAEAQKYRELLRTH
jgi:hypothetical protein